MFGHDRPRPKEFKDKTEGWLHQPGKQEVLREGGAWLDPQRMPGGVNQGKGIQEGKTQTGHIPGRCPAAAIHWKSLHSSPGTGCHGGKGSPGKKVRHRYGPGQVTDLHLTEHERAR